MNPRNYLMSYWTPICLAIITGMTALILASSFFVFDFSVARPHRTIMFMMCLLSGMIICLILFGSILSDHRYGRATYYFMWMISIEFVSLFTELVYWHIIGMHPDNIYLEIIYSFEDILFPVTIYLFGNYEISILDLRKDTSRKMNLVLDIILVVNLLMILGNHFTGVFFTVADSAFVAGPFMPAVFITPLAMIVVCSYMALRYAQELKQRIIMIIYVAVPVVSVLIYFPNYSASTTYLATMVSFILMYAEIYLERGIRIIQNEAKMADQKVALIVSRIEPVFLSEALDSIMAIDGLPKETSKAIREFKKYFEVNIDTITQKAPIPIEQELEHVATYIELEKLRFKEKLSVRLDIRDTEFKIPAMTLQMMVENAIKHGITQRLEGGVVDIIIERDDTHHVITVKDDGVGFDTSAPRDTSRSHVGLENISQRLRDMSNGTFEIESTPGVGTTATVRIPR